MFKILMGLAAASAQVPANTTGYMRLFLDDMQTYFEHSGQYDPTYFKKLEGCLAKYNDTILHKSHDAAWYGMEQYFLSNGTDRD